MFCWRSGHVRLEGSSPPLDIVALNVASCVGECLLRWCVASCVGALPPALACCLVGASSGGVPLQAVHLHGEDYCLQ